LLVVHHTPSPSVHTMVGAVLEGAGADGLEGVEVVHRAALAATAADALAADGYVLVAPANLGTMAGALKHFLDTIYYPCLDETRGRPWGCAIHGNDDVDGALRDLGRIVTGLGWRQVADHVRVLGGPSSDDRAACWNLGASVAAAVIE
jgi:multimeric flavodoxin WrbA